MNTKGFTVGLIAVLTVAVTTVVFHATQSSYKSYIRGSRQFNAGRYQQAVPHLRAAFRMDPQNLEAAELLVQSYERLGQPGSAAQTLETVLQSNADHAPSVERLADTYFAMGRHAEAEAAYRKLIAITGGDNANRKLMQVLLAEKRFGECAVLAGRLARARPARPDLREELGDIQVWAGDYPAAITTYKDLLALKYNEKRIAHKLAEVLRFAGRDQEALTYYNQALNEE